jgi:hypothetical protein
MPDHRPDEEITLKQAAKLPAAKAALARIREIHAQHTQDKVPCHCEAEAALDVMLAAGSRGRTVR